MTTAGETDEAIAAAEVRGVRRIFLVALAAALVAAGAALVVELSHHTSPAPTPSLLPVTFRQAGFVDHVVHRVMTSDEPASRRRGTLRIDPSTGPVYVVARCDTGKLQVVAGSLTTAQPCTGQAVGVVALAQVRRPTRLDITVSEVQDSRWAVGIYR